MTDESRDDKRAVDKRLVSDSQDALLARHSAGAIRRHVFPAGTVLFRKGEVRQCAYLIDTGAVHIHGNDEGGADKLLCVIGAGEIFGEMALIDNTPRSATATTAAECEIFVIPRDALHERVRGLDPVVSLLISLLIERYRLSRISLPETVKQAADSNSIQGHFGRRHDDVLNLRDIKAQRETALREMKLEQELRTGLETAQFIPVLQPILHLPGRGLAGFETLIRWQHPERGLIMPNDFIPVAERTGVVQSLDRLMLERACALLPQLQAAARDDKLFITVNFSGINFGTEGIVDVVDHVLKTSDVRPSCITLEITESALIADPAQAESVLHGLKALGVSVALDDFGTGYSSLGYLHRFEIDTLKIDRSFVASLNENERSRDIVRAIVDLGRNFDLSLVAEGIESEQDAAAINALGCDMGQGYLFSRPLSVEDALAFCSKK